MTSLAERPATPPCHADYEPLVCGAILYDDPDVRTSGWVSRDGSEPVRVDDRVIGQSDTIWLTNINLFRLGQAGLSSRYRHDAWIRVKVSSLLREWGLETRPDEGVRLLSKTFGRVMALMEKTFPTLNLRSPKNSLKPQDSLATLVTTALPVVRHVGDARMKKVAQAAYKTYQNVERAPRGREERRYSAFIAPREEHARKILSTPVPYGPWEEFKEGRPGFPSDMKSRLAWLRDTGRPAVVRVVYRGTGESPLGRILNGETREWWTGEEVLFAVDAGLPGGEIDIVEAHLAKGCEPSPVVLPRGGPLAPLSISYGLFAENLWVAAAEIGTAEARPPWGLFLRAADRMRTTRTALELLSRGIDVFGMGYGVVHASLPIDAEPDDILEIARVTETFAVPGDPDYRAKPRDGDKTDVLRAIYASGGWQGLERLDDMWEAEWKKETE